MIKTWIKSQANGVILAPRSQRSASIPNVRRHLAEQLVVLAESATIEVVDLPDKKIAGTNLEL
jgi:hypothetical protein